MKVQHDQGVGGTKVNQAIPRNYTVKVQVISGAVDESSGKNDTPIIPHAIEGGMAAEVM